MKQHLRIKSFWETSENAVRIQIYSTIISFCMVSLLKTELRITYSSYEILQILGVLLLDKVAVNELLTDMNYKNTKEHNPNQLILNLI